MSKTRWLTLKKLPAILVLAGIGGVLGVLADSRQPPKSSGSPILASPSAPVSHLKARKSALRNPAVAQRHQDWLNQIREASLRRPEEWAAALASTPHWMKTEGQTYQAYRNELERFVSTTGEEGIPLAVQSGVEIEHLSTAIAKQPASLMPGLMKALLADPELVSTTGLGQMILDAIQAGDHRAEALVPIASHLLQFHPDDLAALSNFGTTVGRVDPASVQILTDQIADEASREAILAAAVRSRAGSMEAGPALTEMLENFTTGTPALKAAYRNAGMVHGNKFPKETPALLAWTRSLDGYKQEAALKGWISAVREERTPTAPLVRLFSDPASLEDPAFVDKVLTLCTPAINPSDRSATSELANILNTLPNRAALLEAHPQLKALLAVSP